MKTIYHVKVLTVDGNYTITTDNKYALTTLADEITEKRPDAVVRFGDLIFRAGDFKTATVIKETKEVEA